MRVDIPEHVGVVLAGVSSARTAHARSNGAHDMQCDEKRTGSEIEMMGVLGEFAVRMALGLSLDVPIDDPEGGVDMVFRGRTVQVKTVEKQSHRMIFHTQNHFSADIAVLVVMHTRAVMLLVGYITQDRFRQVRELGKFDGVVKPFVYRKQLSPISELLA